MNAVESKSLIDGAGGDAKFAKLLGLDSEPGFAQRVNNWKRRGIPSDVVLANLDEIRKLQASLAAVPSRRSSATKRSAGR